MYTKDTKTPPASKYELQEVLEQIALVISKECKPMQYANSFGSIELKNTAIHFAKVLAATIVVLILQEVSSHTSDQYAFIIPFVTTAITAVQQYISGE